MTRFSPGLGASLRELGAAVWALGRAAAGLPGSLSSSEPFGERRLARALSEYVWRPLPTVLALSCLAGVIGGLSCASVLMRFHAELAIIPPFAEVVCAQIAPLLVGVFAAGRVSVALSVRLGSMALQGELDALRLQGRDPAPFVLGTVLASLLVAAPVLTAAASISAIVAAGLVLQAEAITPFVHFLALVSTPRVAAKALAGLGHGYVFVLLALAAGGAAGSAAMLDLGHLERRTTSAFTAGLLLVFAAAAILAFWR